MKRHSCLIKLFLTGVGVSLRWAMLFNILVIRFCIVCVAQDRPDVHYVEGLLAERATSHCGVYSLYAVANALGTQPELERLVDGEFVSSSYGSSSLDLMRAAKMLGLHSIPVERWNITALRDSGRPALLNLEVSESGSCGHWVAWLGDQDGQALIYDPSSQLERVSYGVLLTRWKGTAVIVSDEPIGEIGRIGATIVWVSWLLVPLCMVALATTIKPGWADGHRYTLKQVFLGAAIICVMSLMWFGMDLLANDLNTVRNRETTRVSGCQIAPSSRDVPRIGNSQIQAFVKSEANVIVDARPAAYFRMGSIPGAINIPVNSALFDFVERVNQFTEDTPIVVFCERASCQWDQIVASRLLCSGFRNVSVYEPGMEGYYRRKRAKDVE